jgi:hypothetical protein
MIVLLVKIICKLKACGGVTLACDRLFALQQAFYEGPAVVARPDFDLIHTIGHQLHAIQTKWTSWHVRGHQEDFKEWAKS